MGKRVIYLTRLNGVKFVLNAELIESLESAPDTVVSLVNGKKLIIKESVTEVIEKVKCYKKEIYEIKIKSD